jgi:hypothetical protein
LASADAAAATAAAIALSFAAGPAFETSALQGDDELTIDLDHSMEADRRRLKFSD